jgi:16S rRNA (adenine1518-N6/adenine1519-N6)-dimethyltransferase
VTYLDETYPKLKDKIISQDFLRYTLMKFLRGSSSLSLGILQYFDTNCFRTLEYRDQIPEFAGMFQKRVAQRICEKKGTKAWNIISFSTGFYDAEYLFTVDENVLFRHQK